MLVRIKNKLFCEIYRFLHPYLWGKKLQINGIPEIVSMKKLNIGENVSINKRCYLQCGGGVTLGDNVTLSYGTVILTQGLDTCNYISNSKNKYRIHKSGDVHIGNGTWICANVTICPGAKVANNCIVAAGSVVAGNLVENNCLYGGCPAKKIKRLD